MNSESTITIKAGEDVALDFLFTQQDQFGNDKVALTGNVSTSEGSAIVTGDGTCAFTTELIIGMFIYLNDEGYRIYNISNDQLLQLETVVKDNLTSVKMYKDYALDLTGITVRYTIKKQSDLNVTDADDSDAIWKNDISSFTYPSFGMAHDDIPRATTKTFANGIYLIEYGYVTAQGQYYPSDTQLFVVESKTLAQRT
jgi:hypothetical protein